MWKMNCGYGYKNELEKKYLPNLLKEYSVVSIFVCVFLALRLFETE